MNQKTTPTSNTAPLWHLHIEATSNNPDNPLASLPALARLIDIESASATLDWHDPQAVVVWGVGQHSAVLLDTLSTALLACASSEQTRFVMRQMVAGLIAQPHINLGVLHQALDDLATVTTKLAELSTLAKTLHGLCRDRGLGVPALAASAPADASLRRCSLDTSSGAIQAVGPQDFTEQLLGAMISVTAVEPLPVDSHGSPYEELMALFTREWSQRERACEPA
jgi:hypothetical protein